MQIPGISFFKLFYINAQNSKTWKTIVTSSPYISAGEIWYSKFGSIVVVHGAISLSQDIPENAVIGTGLPKPLRSANVPVFVLSINPYNHLASIDANGNLVNTNLVSWGAVGGLWWDIFATYVCQ